MNVFYTPKKVVFGAGCILLACMWSLKVVATGNAALPPPGNPRYLSLSIMNVESNDNYLPIMERAAAAGINSFLLNVNWERIYSKRGAPANWDQIDKQAALAVQLNCKIMLRIWVARHDDGNEGWWPEQTRPISGNGDKKGLLGGFSFSDQNAVEEANGFVREVLEHFKGRQQAGQIAFVTVINTSHAEIGFNIDGYNSAIQQHGLMVFDYSYHSRRAFQDWVQNKYKNLSNLNQAWNSDFSRFSDISPPYIYNDVWSATYGAIGKDWYLFRHYELKNIIQKFIATTKSVDPSYKYINDMGSCYDPLSILRITLGFKDLCENTDGLKLNDNYEYPHRFATDLVRSNLPGKIVGQEIGNVNAIGEQNWREHINEAFEHGADWVNFFGFDQSFNFPAGENLIREMAAKWLNSPVQQIQTTQTVSYTLSEAVSQGGTSSVQGRWRTEYNKTRRPVKVLLLEDMLGETTIANQLPVVQTPLMNQLATVSQWFQYEIPTQAFRDPDGFITGITATGLPTGLSLSGWRIEGKAFATGEHTITITATDNSGAKVSTTFKLSVTGTSSGNIVSLFKAGNFLTRRFVRYIQEGDTLRGEDIRQTSNILVSPRSGAVGSYSFAMSGPYSISSEDSQAPYGLFGDNGGVMLKSGNYTLTIKSYVQANLKGSLLSEQVLRFVVVENSQNQNLPPVLHKVPADLFAKTGQPFALRLSDSTFIDPDGFLNSFTITGLPDGLRGDGTLISGTPTQKGIYTVNVRATDNGGSSSETKFKFTISADNIPPYVSGRLSNLSAEINKPFSYTIPGNIFSDSDGQISSVTVLGLPEGMSGNGSLISGVPKKVGVFQLIAIATDNENASVQLTFQLTVFPENKAPLVAKALTDQVADSGAVFSYVLPDDTFLDTDGEITRLEISGLPAGLTAQGKTIGGTPTQTGEFLVVVKAFDNKEAFVQTSFKLTVRKNVAPPAFNRIPDLLAVMGQVFYFDILQYFKDAQTSTLTISYASALPPGITANGSRLSGNPTAVGEYPMKAIARDSKGGTTEVEFRIIVQKPELRVMLHKAGGASGVIREIANADIIALSTLSDTVNIFIESNANITTIMFEMTGPVTYKGSDEAAPFGLYPGTSGFKPRVGTYQFKVTAYRNTTVVTSRTIQFDIIVASNTPVREGVVEYIPAPAAELWKPFPNPYTNRVQVQIAAEGYSSLKAVEVWSVEGAQLPLPASNWRVEGALLELDLSQTTPTPGTYILRLTEDNGKQKAVKIVKMP
ncbi:putative Ig domain-containing protein [Arundinibacter roseus]|uniref:T9SS type A sorting domain-containing protein n=1 Tax=Arundinibacter roseus TaxID=2070510 RepID=A0A4R4KQG7_9BACT|nr:putative Ig domain-containing protein [Arundinibacter roseus]TDB69216.1 T9SS type A sorting domain-containing protein [Arundinibacter roseus]